MYKLLALDLDGTLLNNNGEISKANAKAIELAKEKGIKVVLATGRPIDGIKNYISQLNLLEDDYVVAFNGALVQKTRDKTVIGRKGLTISDLNKIYELSKKLNVNIHIHTDKECITPKISKYSLFEAKLNSIPLKEIGFEDLQGDTVINKIMFIDEEQIIDKISGLIDEEFHDEYTVVRSLPYFLEFLNKEVNKGIGVKMLANSLGISMDEVICIGDHENDIHMIQYAGLGVAMGNAVDSLKNAADYITKSNEENGVAHVIEKFILN
ncbi:sugar-phosphatase [Clostridium fungisolvens]|uniref:Sugar phosphatase YidA n=1 Tax=Clostridium fungisolvens TaxID=1604897 RepID=A0A6V8SBU4_9CLOT|nr:sugar-phosphatase [Clostridium fungisolvens]GFP74709.1 Sugar phosphatase YidA [Clostridium fungisolvens]